jgi:hypothetical protein
MWGAARHFRATGVHRPLVSDVMAFAPSGADTPTHIRAQIDLVGLGGEAHDGVVQAICAAGGVAPEQVVVSYSHTHAAGLFTPDRVDLPGGELIPEYLQELTARVADATAQAVSAMQEVTITYATGCCNLAVNRDYWDDERSLYACGFNPDAPADDTVSVARVTATSGDLLCTLVNYACHPTTLAWENTLNSPDYPGAMRDAVEAATGAPCVFALGACGELGPRQGYVGDPAVADHNGRQLGYAALATLEAMDPPGVDFAYSGPVVSGATLGTWAHQPQTDVRVDETKQFAGSCYTVELPLRDLSTVEELRAEMDDWLAKQKEADAQGDAVAARDYGARAERARRWIMRVQNLPGREHYPLPYSVHRMGDAFWVTTAGEPYSLLQTALRDRFPDLALLVSPVAGPMQIGYLLPRDRYGQGLYQEEPSILAPGCLESLIDEIAQRIESLM